VTVRGIRNKKSFLSTRQTGTVKQEKQEEVTSQAPTLHSVSVKGYRLVLVMHKRAHAHAHARTYTHTNTHTRKHMQAHA
jgi:hypothetical protein